MQLSLGGRSSTWLERRPVTPEVAGSSPVGPAEEVLVLEERGLFYAISPRNNIFMTIHIMAFFLRSLFQKLFTF